MRWLTLGLAVLMVRAEFTLKQSKAFWKDQVVPMKVRNSIKSLRARHRDNRVVRRRGRLFVINKTNRRFKARQG